MSEEAINDQIFKYFLIKSIYNVYLLIIFCSI